MRSLTGSLRYVSALLLLCAPLVSLAVDQNGYTAQYECRAGGANCNVDVDALARQSCDQVITPATSPTNSWSVLNQNNTVICLQAGDHRARGVLTLTSRGDAGRRKVLRYIRSSDSNDSPWKQSFQNRAIVKGIRLVGADYWVLHRLTLDGDGASHPGVEVPKLANSGNNILSRLLIEDYRHSLIFISWNDNTDNVVQNSVLRNAIPQVENQQENECIYMSGGHGKTLIVNNEMYNCNKAIHTNNGGDASNVVIENNDMYLTPDYYTDCNGNYNRAGPCAAAESIVAIKGGGSAGRPLRIIQNRLWGARVSDARICCGGIGTQGEAMFITNSPEYNTIGASWILFANNILADSQFGVANFWASTTRNSIIGNLIHDIRRYKVGTEGYTALQAQTLTNSEWYFNTVANSPVPWMNFGGSATGNDIRCNVVVNSGGMSGTVGGGTQIEYNVFYAAPAFTTGSANDITRASTSESGMGDFCYYRKLQTGPERVCVPNVRPGANSPHVSKCPADTGSRPGIGISDGL